MTTERTEPDIYRFYDYREYLRARYEYMHSGTPWFSYRYIQRKTGINPGFLYKVFQATKHLPRSALAKMAGMYKLSKRQNEYLNLMYLYARARNNEELRFYFEKMLGFSDPLMKRIDSNAYEYYTKWYYAAVRQIVSVYRFSGNYRQLAMLTLPPITVTEAKKAVRLLEKLAFIKKQSDGSYTLTSSHLTTGEQWRSIAIRSFQQQTIQLARNALDNLPKEDRDISTVTTTMSLEDLEAARERIRQFRKDIMDLTTSGGKGERVYHVNIQLFPITERLQ